MGFGEGAQRHPPIPAKGLCSEAKGLAYREEHPEAGEGRAGHAAEPQPGPGPGRQSKRMPRRRRLSPAPASFSRAALARWPPPAGAGRRAQDPELAAHVPVGRWGGVRAARSSPGDTRRLLMPRAGAQRANLRKAAQRERGREREHESAQSCAPRGPGAGGRQQPRRPTHSALAPRAERPAGRRAPETLAHGRPSGRGGRRCPLCRAASIHHHLQARASGRSLPAATATADANRPPGLWQSSAHPLAGGRGGRRWVPEGRGT